MQPGSWYQTSTANICVPETTVVDFYNFDNYGQIKRELLHYESSTDIRQKLYGSLIRNFLARYGINVTPYEYSNATAYFSDFGRTAYHPQFVGVGGSKAEATNSLAYAVGRSLENDGVVLVGRDDNGQLIARFATYKSAADLRSYFASVQTIAIYSPGTGLTRSLFHPFRKLPGDLVSSVNEEIISPLPVVYDAPSTLQPAHVPSPHLAALFAQIRAIADLEGFTLTLSDPSLG